MRCQNTIRLLCVSAALAFGWFVFSKPSAAGYSRQTQVDFERDIRPLLHAHCIERYGADKQKSGLRLDHKAAAVKGGTGGAVIVPGNGAEVMRVVEKPISHLAGWEFPAASVSVVELTLI